MTIARALTEDWRSWPTPAKLRLLQRLRESEATPSSPEDLARRRALAGDPWRYARDVLGYKLVPQQEQVFELFERMDRVLVPAANNVGKTFILAVYGLYRFDIVAALPPSDGREEEERGAHVLLVGPDDATVFSTIWQEILTHAARAEARGWTLPGTRSERSVLWHNGPGWFFESFSPPRRAGEEVRHTASGRHHENQIALIEEMQGVDQPTVRAVESMCSSRGNKVLAAYNPTEPVGPASEREASGAYAAIHLSALDHPNITTRSYVVPDAIDYLLIDARVRTECRDLGPHRVQQPDRNEGDFLYALPRVASDGGTLLEERGPRADGIPGHPEAQVHVFRPGGMFDPQVRGRYPRSSSSALCDPADWDAAVARWRERSDPDDAPDRIGADMARSPEGDDPVVVASWGEDAEALLRRHAALIAEGKDPLEHLQPTRSGVPIVLQKGDGPDLAVQIVDRFPSSPVNVDEGGVGTSGLDHGRRVLKRLNWSGVSFGSRPEWMDHPVPGEPLYENVRALMYGRAGALVRMGLVDIPDDPELRKEFLAHYLILKWRVVETEERGRDGKRLKERKPSYLLCEKKEVKKKVGHSPDRADAWVLSLFGAARKVVYEYRTSSRSPSPNGFAPHPEDQASRGGRYGGGRGF